MHNCQMNYKVAQITKEILVLRSYFYSKGGEDDESSGRLSMFFKNSVFRIMSFKMMFSIIPAFKLNFA